MRTFQVIILITCIVGPLTAEDDVIKEQLIEDLDDHATDPEWKEVVENNAQPILSGILKRGFNNMNLRKFTTNEHYYHFSFDPIYLQENNNDVTITDLASSNAITSRLRHLETDMLHNVFILDVDLNNIEMKGSYEMVNRDQIGMLPVTHTGRIKITLQNVTATGFVGFKRGSNDSLTTTNYNLNYNVENIKIEVTYLGLNRDKPIRSEIEYDSIDKTLLKLFQADLWYKVQTQVIKYNLDYVLADVSVQELFLHKNELLDRYSFRGDILDRLANRIVDQFLLRANVLIRDKGLSRIPIENFQRSFQESWGPVTLWGGFHAEDGYASNLSTIHRTGNFSIVHQPPNEFIAFGALGLKEFGFNYNKYKAQIWNVGPSGDIKAAARSNSVAFKMNVNGMNPSKPIYIKKFDFFIEKLDDVDVQLTGMGYPLNWLVSRSATWMYGLFKTRVRSSVEQIMEQHLQTLVDQRQDINPHSV